MKLLEVRDGFIKFETRNEISLSSFVQINDNDKKYIAQIVQIRNAGDCKIAHAKILYLYDGTFLNYDNTLPSKDSELLEFGFDILSESISARQPIVCGNFIKNNLEIAIEKEAFNKKTLICFDTNENNKIVVSNISNQFEKSLIIDTLGIFDFPKYVAGVDFKLPLNTESLNFIFEDCLTDATSDSKSLIKDIFNDLSDYSKTVPFVPFGALKTIIDDMVDKSHIFKLLVLKNKLAKFEKLGYFAANVSEVNNLNKILSTDNAVIDLSKLDTTFQNRYLSIILNTIAKLDKKPQIFVEASNNLDKKNLKKIITGGLSTTFITHSRYKYINEIKSMFTNYIIEPSFVNNTTFRVFSTFLNSMNKNTYLIFGESTNGLPLVSTVIKRIEQSKSTLEELENDLVINIEESDEEQNPSNLAITKKSNELIDKVSEEVQAEENNIEEGLFDESIEEIEDDIDNETIVEISEIIEEDDDNDEILEEIDSEDTIELTQSDEEEILEDEFIEEAHNKDEIIEDNENVVLTDDNKIVSLAEDDSSDNIDEITDSEFIEENSLEDNYEEIDVEFNTTLEENSYEEIQENIEEEILEEVADDDETQDDINLIKVDEPIEEYEALDSELVDITEDNEETLLEEDEIDVIVELDESEFREDDIVIDLAEEDNVEDSELERAIVEDVDKVYTTMKDENISDTDLDFIDELNSSLNEDDTLTTEGFEELPELNEIEEDDSLLTPIEEINSDSLDNDSNEDILETRKASTPMVPVYKAEIPSEDLVNSDALEQGDTVVHAKYGNGVVEKMIKYGNKKLYSINFDNVGRRLLDPTLTELKKC